MSWNTYPDVTEACEHWLGRGYCNDMGYNKGMAVFTHTIGGLMYEAAIGGQKFSFTPL